MLCVKIANDHRVLKFKNRRSCRNSRGLGLCRMCRFCIIYKGKAVIYPSVCPCTLVDQATLKIFQRRCFRRLKRCWNRVSPLWKCLDHRCGGLSLVDAFTVQTNLFFQKKNKKQKKKRCRAVLNKISVNCGCPWPIQASFCSTRWVNVSFSILHLSKVIIGNAFGCVLQSGMRRVTSLRLRIWWSGRKLLGVCLTVNSFTSRCGSFVIHHRANGNLIQITQTGLLEYLPYQEHCD